METSRAASLLSVPRYRRSCAPTCGTSGRSSSGAGLGCCTSSTRRGDLPAPGRRCRGTGASGARRSTEALAVRTTLPLVTRRSHRPLLGKGRPRKTLKRGISASHLTSSDCGAPALPYPASARPSRKTGMKRLDLILILPRGKTFNTMACFTLRYSLILGVLFACGLSTRGDAQEASVLPVLFGVSASWGVLRRAPGWLPCCHGWHAAWLAAECRRGEHTSSRHVGWAAREWSGCSRPRPRIMSNRFSFDSPLEGLGRRLHSGPDSWTWWTA